MNKHWLREEFGSEGGREYKFKIGKFHASALSGFIAGAIFASIIWFAVAHFMNLLK
jgi:hypothetical protein